MKLYAIQLIVSSGLLLLTYKLLLEKERLSLLKRVVLLLGIVLCFLLPLIKIEVKEASIPIVSEGWVMVQEQIGGTSEAMVASPIKASSIDWWLVVYIGISSLLLIRFVVNLIKLLAKVRSHQRFSKEGIKVVLTSENLPPHSFLHFVFINRNDWQRLPNEVWQHEAAHVRQKHTLDVLLMELVLVIVWFNPFFYWWRNAVRLNHEFLADDAVLKNNNTKQYQELLFKTAAGNRTSQLVLTSGFYFPTIKKRLLMMTKSTSKAASAFRLLMLCIIAGAFPFLFAANSFAQVSDTAQTKPKTQSTEVRFVAPADVKHNKWIEKSSIGYSKAGAASILLEEYSALTRKYIPDPNNREPTIYEKITPEDRQRMEYIFKQMSLEQQVQQQILFFKPLPPFPKNVPSQKQFQAFKNKKVYGVWIDDKRVDNIVLDNYNPNQFAHVYISKLHGAAKKGRSYTHQINLMTVDYYEKYRRGALANKQSNMVIHYPGGVKKK